MDIRARILAAISWGEPDRVPLTVYDWMLPRGETERRLRESGVGIITRLPAHTVEYRQVEFSTREYREGGRKRIRKGIHTPVGDLYQVVEPEGAYETTWILEHFIKGPDDYKAMEFVWRDAIFHDNYPTIREAARRIGGDGLVFVRMGKSPMQEMLYQMLGMERFGLDYLQRRDLFDSLYDTMTRRYEELYDLAAGAPVPIIQLGDNITSDVVGDERYRKYCMPVYKALRDRISPTGKKLAVHMDGRLRSLSRAIAESDFDIMEAMTPPPMGDFSIREARHDWPNKALWINFTSNIHLEAPEVIQEHTRELLQEAGGKPGFAIGVTEDAPVEALERSLAAIAQVLEENR